MTANERMRERWNDDDQVRNWPKRECVTTVITPSLIERLAPRAGERVLDVGCGGGLSTLEAARAVGPGGAATGFDLSEGLVALATDRAREAGLRNVRFINGDAQADEIPGAPFDAAISQFGVMFFDNPVAAFSNIRQHLRPAGRLVFACWQSPERNAWLPAPALAKYAPAPPAPSRDGAPPPGPFALADAARVRTILEQAGFSDVHHDEAVHESIVPEGSVYEREMIEVMGVDPAQREKAWQDVLKLVEPLRVGDGNVRLELAAHFFSAKSV